MKKIVIVSIFCLCFGNVKAQTNAEQIASRIAQRIQDSLQLSDSLRLVLYSINMQLNDQKTSMRNQYVGNDSLIRRKVQWVENRRDSLYQTVLPSEKYYLYLQKKKLLVHNN